jgi:hypothetical protein
MRAAEITNEVIRRIRISCRCGTESVAEVPEDFARLTNVYVCPNCRALFRIQKQDDNWKIERISYPHRQLLSRCLGLNPSYRGFPENLVGGSLCTF